MCRIRGRMPCRRSRARRWALGVVIGFAGVDRLGVRAQQTVDLGAVVAQPRGHRDRPHQFAARIHRHVGLVTMRQHLAALPRPVRLRIGLVTPALSRRLRKRPRVVESGIASAVLTPRNLRNDSGSRHCHSTSSSDSPLNQCCNSSILNATSGGCEGLPVLPYRLAQYDESRDQSITASTRSRNELRETCFSSSTSRKLRCGCELPCSVFPLSKPRRYWTQELCRNFTVRL